MTIEDAGLREFEATMNRNHHRLIDLLQELVNLTKQNNEANKEGIKAALDLTKTLVNMNENSCMEHYPVEPITNGNIKAPEPEQTGQVTESEKKDGFYQ